MTHPLDADAQIVQAANAQRLIVFCGAGISMLAPSNTPSWWEIYAAVAHALETRFRDSFPSLAEHLDVAWLLAPLQTQQLADIVMARFGGEQFSEILKVVDVGDPNENHICLAALAAVGALRGIVTTNFDTLVERASLARGYSFDVHTPFASGETPGSAAATPLIKIHGSAADGGKLLEASWHKARAVDHALAAAWNDILPGADLLVIGYSGADLGGGTAATFFRDFLASGDRIWWLHRPGTPPILPDGVRSRTVLIEGMLPDFLRGLSGRVDASRFEVPLIGLDPQLALRKGMDYWSRAPHVGRWAAATFFYSLGCLRDRHFRDWRNNLQNGRFRDSRLQTALANLALESALQCAPGARLNALQVIGLPSFLSTVGMHLLGCSRIDDAVTALCGAVELSEAVFLDVQGWGTREALDETHSNLSTFWSNYGQTLLASQKGDEALASFFNSLRHAYQCGDPSSFLSSLQNIVHHGFESLDIRRCMQIAEGSICVADRTGAVRPSIEFRILLAGYHIDRNELWVAARHLAEAKQRASALNDGATIDAIAIIEAHLLLRRGRIHDGLEAISSILSTSDNYTFLSRTTTRVWEYLAILGDHRAHRYLRFDSNEIERIATSAEQEISAARLSNRAPWAGRLFSVPFSGHIGELDGDALTALGATEFGGAPEQAAAFGVDLSKKLLTAGYVRDASWAARNVIDNPHSLPQHRGRAHALWASTRAELGFLDSAEQHINKAKRIFGDLGERSSAFAAATGLWHSIQSGNVAGAREWARELGLSVTDDDSSNRFCTETARRIDSWGESMAPAAAALRATFQSRFASSLECRSDGTPLGQFRAFRGMWQTRLEGEQEQRLRDGERLLTESNARAALAVVEQLPTAEPLLWDFEDERIVSLRIRALGSESAASEVDKAMNPERERLFGALAFAALSRLEGAVYELAVKQGDRELAAEVITKRAFIADLSAEPCAAIGLRLLEATFLESVTSSRSSSHRASSARAASQYFGFVQRTGK